MDRRKIAVRATDLERVLDRYESPVLGSHFRATLPVGRITRLLVSLQGQDIVAMSALESIAHKEAGIASFELRKTYLPQFQEWGFVRVYDDKIEETIDSRGKILDKAGELWEQSNPNPVEKLSVELFDQAATAPRKKDTIQRLLDDYKADTSESALSHLSETNLVDQISDKDGTWFYSPEVFGENFPKTLSYLSNQSNEKRKQAYRLIDAVSGDQGIPHSSLTGMGDAGLTHQLSGAGLLMGYPLNAGGRQEVFYFTPDLRNRFESEGRGDKFELAKTGISHFQFAHRLAEGGTGRLKFNPSVFLGKLIEKGRAGNATAIGTDYYLLVQKGLVKIERSEGSKYRFLLPDSKEKIADLEIIRDAFEGRWPIPTIDFGRMGLPLGADPGDSIVYRSRKGIEAKSLARQFAREVFKL